MTDTNLPAPATIPELFERLASEGQVQSLRRTSGTYEFNIEDGGHWFLALDHGTPSVQNQSDHPNCTISCTAADLLEIAAGKRNFVTAYLRGDLSCTGDLPFALNFRRLLAVAA
jgi:hypothetical protein